jgi:LPXTG-site transpeptidase (sortase) family protein
VKAVLLKLLEYWYETAVFMVLVGFATFTVLGIGGELPATLQVAAVGGISSEYFAKEEAQEFNAPDTLIIPRVDINTAILLPESTDEQVLNDLLLKGVVQYPGSGFIGETKPVFLFGHSTRRNTLASRYYRYLNGLDQVKVGDEIQLTGGGKKAIYEVTSAGVYKNYEVKVDLSSKINNLVISTCSRIGAKEDRVVVEARLVKII